MQHCSTTYEVLRTRYPSPTSTCTRHTGYILPTPVTTASTLEYCLLFILHSENCIFLGGFQSSKILVSTAATTVFTLVEGERQAVVKGPQHRHFIRRHGATERRHIFLRFEIRHSGKHDSRLVQIKLLTDLSMNTTAFAGPHKSGAAWKEERIEMNTCNGTLTIVTLN